MYPQRQNQYQLMDAGTMYHQPLLQHHITYPTIQPPLPPPVPEPLPSATDVHTNALSISQLADFSATMVYLMWHDRCSSVLPHQASRNSGNEETSNAFKKYCRSILQATQLSESVVLLSLKYIALLLRNNPQLRGAEGSEYRLYTVALMLANKFLDDNTFTNKTWSDISGMKMHELNMMEFEFLDVLQYLLFIPKADFDYWKSTLFNFRSQLHDSSITDGNLRDLHQCQFIEATMKIMGLPMQYHHHQLEQHEQQNSQWSRHHQFQQQQHQQQQEPAIQHHHHRHHHHHHQQQQAVEAQQQYNQHLYLLSKTQQPHIPPQQLDRPLARVPLRIPVRPLYQTQDEQTSSSTSATQYSTEYDSTVGITSATVIQPATAINPQTTQQSQLTHPPFRNYNYTRPSIDKNFNVDTYPGQNQQQPSTAHVIAPIIPSHTNSYVNDIYSQQQQQQQTPQSSVHQQPPNPLNNGLSDIATSVPPLQQISIQPTSTAPPFYYSTPSAPPTSVPFYHHDQSQPSSHYHHHHPTNHIHGGSSSNPPYQMNYSNRSSYYMNAQHQHTMPIPAGNVYNGYGMVAHAINDMYGRPILSRIPPSTSYQHQTSLNGITNQNSSSDSQPSTNQAIPTAISPQIKNVWTAKPTSGPVPEDPLTAAESYRVPSYD
ncbi:hypothetical protein BCR42DRAFT_450992 [Absidia repens]|uniref:Cyclin-domain-containing protein n=1 Tax=Absidia repens TaxID=90262 RepID=A0A1X2IIK8_9FUNG|nr:hypothetical protein BCR42DRAFT_450992 [Absidia repens]